MNNYQWFAVLFFIVIDAFWIFLNTKLKNGLYSDVGSNDNLNFVQKIFIASLGYAIVFAYIIYHPQESYLDAFLENVFLGGAIYVEYNITAYVLFPAWHFKTAFFDTLWGSSLIAMVGLLNHFLETV